MSAQTYPTDLTSCQWSGIIDLIPVAKPAGRSCNLDMRQAINTILSIPVSGAQSCMLPTDYPKWKSVYYYFRIWRTDGTWQRIHDTVRAEARRCAGRHKQ